MNRFHGLRWLVVLWVVILSACGFQLRGASTLPPEFNPLYLEPGNLTARQQELLRNSLRRASAQLTSDQQSAKRLFVSMTETPLRRLVNSSPGAIELYRLEMQLEFRVQSPQGDIRVDRRSIRQSVDIELDSANVLSHDDRTRDARDELTRSLVRNMIFQLKRR